MNDNRSEGTILRAFNRAARATIIAFEKEGGPKTESQVLLVETLIEMMQASDAIRNDVRDENV
jgi:predicted HAD superfamily phosphohydrolase